MAEAFAAEKKKIRKKRDTNSKELFGLNRSGSRAVKTSLSKWNNNIQSVSTSIFPVQYVAYREHFSSEAPYLVSATGSMK